MKKVFVCSLCHNGVLGGGLYVDDTAITYKTNKLTVAKEYRNLVLPLNEIRQITWNWILATVTLTSGTQYRFLIFNKPGFEKCYQQLSQQ